jgi:peptide-methionine (S)-S-oxide reductase
VIFHHSPEQERIAREAMADVEASGTWSDPVVTELMSAPEFYPAEAYHTRYFERNGGQPYCQFVVAPKVAKARKTFFDRLKKEG